MEKTVENFIPEFIISPKYRIYRHLLLVFVVLVIVVDGVIGNYLYSSAEKISMVWVGICYFIVFLGVIYLNIYLFMPFLFLKGKYFWYLFCLAVTIGLSLYTVKSSMSFYFHIDEFFNELGTFLLSINMASSFVVLAFFISGSTVFRLLKYWILNNRRIDELEVATLQSELQLLKNQINPHFLFNMLNNANVLIWKHSEEAARVLFKLEDLLRYQLNDTFKDSVLLSSDIRFLNDFLNLEKIRRDKFTFTITCEGEIERVQIPSLLFIPFVENAVKHNPDSDHASFVRLVFRIDSSSLEFTCANSKPIEKGVKKETGGIGLKNIRRRLSLLYPGEHVLDIEDMETTYRVTLKLNL